MNHTESAYGLWSLVIINSAIFIMFAFSFFKPATARDWRTFGAFAAFIVALFVEMYGFPLTIYLISGWLQTKFPNLDLLSHTSGHLWSTLLGEKGDPHFGVLHIASYVFLGFGFYLLSTAWNVLYHAQRGQSLATTGPGVSEFLCKRDGLQLTQIRSPNSMVNRFSAAFQSRIGMLHFWLMLRKAR